MSTREFIADSLDASRGFFFRLTKSVGYVGVAATGFIGVASLRGEGPIHIKGPFSDKTSIEVPTTIEGMIDVAAIFGAIGVVTALITILLNRAQYAIRPKEQEAH